MNSLSNLFDEYIFRWRADGGPTLYTGWVLGQIRNNDYRLYELALIFRRRNGSLAMVISVSVIWDIH